MGEGYELGGAQMTEEVMRKAAGKMPAQKPGLSKQDYGTPRVFLDAVERRFGKLVFDLAATSANSVARRYYGYRADRSFTDSLAQEWTKLKGTLWLNPPFAHIEPWAKKCCFSASSLRGPKIFFLVPASVGSEWFARHVFDKALVLFLVGRLSFDG